MMDREKYRTIIIISFILLIICSAFLLGTIWNSLTMNPGIQVGSRIYFLVILIVILASVIFILHLFEEKSLISHWEPEQESPAEMQEAYDKPSARSHSELFNINIDLIAESIIPKTDEKESVRDYAEQILLNLARHFEIVQGIIFLKNPKTKEFESICTFAYTADKDPAPFKTGDGIPGQVAKNKTILFLTAVPEGYLQVESGLGHASPKNLLFIPLLLNKETFGIIELASFKAPDKKMEWTFTNLAKIIGNALITKIKSSEQK